jgi:D-alanine-D-alanine ligase
MLKHKHGTLVCVLYNRPNPHSTSFSQADEDTQKTAYFVEQALTSLGFVVSLCGITPQTIGAIDAIHADCIFNLIEWTGDDLVFVASVFQALEKTHIPFTGASFVNYFTTSQKVPMKQCFSLYDIPTASYQIVTSDTESIRTSFHFPVIVKVSAEHCGIGLSSTSICQDSASTRKQVDILLEQFHQPIIVEEYIQGTEYQVTMMEIDKKPVMLPVAQYEFASHNPYEILTYENRWVTGIEHCGYTVKIATLPMNIQKELNRLSVRIFKAFDFHDYARFDIRINKGRIYIIEANSNPGLDDEMDNGLAVSFHAGGYTFATFLEQIIASSMQRFSKKDNSSK